MCVRARVRLRVCHTCILCQCVGAAAAWSAPVATALPNNNAGIHATVLQSGVVAIAYNNMSGDPGHDLRNILAVSLSDDGGETFSATRLLEKHASTNAAAAGGEGGAGGAGVGAGGDAGGSDALQVDGIGPTSCDCYSYPTMEQTADGAIYVAFTYQRRTIKVSRISEAWVRATDGPLCQ
jgi:predicted neuraminidase